MNAPIFFGFPTVPELCPNPQRAILAALDANLVLAVRTLHACHPDLAHAPGEPLLLLAESITAVAMSLHSILVAYDDLAQRRAHLDWNASLPALDALDPDCCF